MEKQFLSQALPYIKNLGYFQCMRLLEAHGLVHAENLDEVPAIERTYGAKELIKLKKDKSEAAKVLLKELGL